MSLINSNIGTSDELYVPDFSYAGYHNGLKEIPELNKKNLFTLKLIKAIKVQ